jgi:hypothetical protein
MLYLQGMRILRPTIPLLAATVLALGATVAHAETPADEAEDAVWACVKEFARSLAHNSPLKTDAITEQSLRSCNASVEAYRGILMDSPEALSLDEVEKRLLVSRQLAIAVAGTIVDWVRSEQPVASERFQGLIRPETNEPDGGVWMNPGLTEEQTAEARRPNLFLPAAGDSPRQP